MDMSKTPETVIKGSLPDLLGAICNQPSGRQEMFFLKPKIGGDTIPGFTIHWWVANDQPFYKLVFDLANIGANLLNHFSVGEAVRAILASVKDNLNDFNLIPFLDPAQPHTTLFKCSSTAGVKAVSQGILRLVSASRRGLFLFPVRRLKPEFDVISPELVWLTSSAPRQAVEPLLQITDPQLTFDRFPPWRDQGGRLLQIEDSTLGLIEDGREAGVTALRQLAGALCLTLPVRDAILKSDEIPVAGTVAIFMDGEIDGRALGPFLPPLTGVKVFPRQDIDCMKNFLKPRASQERDTRYRVALEFLALGWLFRESQAFINWFIAIDALFGSRDIENWKQNIVERVGTRLSSLEGDIGNKIGLLVDIRSDMLHGRCSSMSSSRNFLRYWRRFQKHPLRDMLLVVRECLKLEP